MRASRPHPWLLLHPLYRRNRHPLVSQTLCSSTVSYSHGFLHDSVFLTYSAPILYLHSEETKYPTDLTTFLAHTTPQVNYTAVADVPSPLTLSNVNQLGEDVHLTSNDDPTSDPDWLKGTAPDSNGATSGINSAIIVNEKNDSSVDVFYFYFYAFNPGTNVLGQPFLNFGKPILPSLSSLL